MINNQRQTEADLCECYHSKATNAGLIVITERVELGDDSTATAAKQLLVKGILRGKQENKLAALHALKRFLWLVIVKSNRCQAQGL